MKLPTVSCAQKPSTVLFIADHNSKNDHQQFSKIYLNMLGVANLMEEWELGFSCLCLF